MAKRMLVMLTLTLLIVGGLGFVKFRQVQAAIAEGAAYQAPPEAVTTVVATRAEWASTHHAIGTVDAVRGVTVSADLAGIVDQVRFDSGDTVREGQVLAVLDTRQEQAQFTALDAHRTLARLNFNRMQDLLDQRVVSRAEYDSASAEARQADARVDEVGAAIDRKTIRAPFTGVLGIRQVNKGQYLAPGDAVVALQALNPIYVNFGVPQQAIGAVRVGRRVRINSDAIGAGEFDGRVTAVDSVVDPTTRNIQVQATAANPGMLRPGMFVQTTVTLGGGQSVIPVPASAVNYAPYGDSVYVVSDLKDDKGRAYRGVRQQIVTLGATRGDQVAILSGIRPGDEVVTSGVFKLRNGAPVLVNNKVRPANNPAAKPENS